MSTPIKRIEKDFLIKSLYDEQIQMMYLKGKGQYTLTLEKPGKGQLFLKSNRPIEGLKVHSKLDLMFDYRGQIIMFHIEVSSFKDQHIVADEPEFLFKNLDRSFSRVSTPKDLQVQFSFLGDRYSLTYPKINEYANEDAGEMVRALDPKNLSALVDSLASWIKGYASDYKLVVFRDTKPSTIEERIVAETGKSLFIPSTLLTLPKEDPFPKKRLITEDIFKRYLESTGVNQEFIEEVYTKFLRQKSDSGITSDLYVPILFHEYVIGYIHLWIEVTEMLPLDYDAIDTLYQFSKILTSSLKLNGYFETGKLKNSPFDGKIIDISASGLLFAYPLSELSTALLPDAELTVKLKTALRTVNANAKIVRRYKDTVQGFFGCRFIDMEPEDLRFLFEYIYGKPFTDNDAAFFHGRV